MDVEHQDLAAVETTQVVAIRKMLSDASDEVRLLSVYRLANTDQRKIIDSAVRLVIEGLDIADLFRGRG